MIEVLIYVLLKISSFLQQCKDFENRLTFGKAIAKVQHHLFEAHCTFTKCLIDMNEVILVIRVTLKLITKVQKQIKLPVL